MDERQMPHGFIMQDRKNASLTGVKEVESFTDEMIILKTVMGKLCIKGTGLHIGRFSADTGELEFDGNFNGMVYTGDGRHKTVKGRLFK